MHRRLCLGVYIVNRDAVVIGLQLTFVCHYDIDDNDDIRFDLEIRGSHSDVKDIPRDEL
jgi:hypothetical protein